MPLTEREYWRGRRKWAVAHTELWTRGKFISGPAVGILAFILQWEWGLRLVIPTVQFIVTLVAAYFVVALIQLLINWIYYAPVALERGRLDEITKLANENRKLKDSEKLVSFQFTQTVFLEEMFLEEKQTPPVIIVHAKVLNHGGSALTLYDIRLTSESDHTISRRPSFNDFPKHAIDDIRLGPGAVDIGYFRFDGSGIERNWALALEYLDNRGTRHREPIPAALSAAGGAVSTS
jgi:hypothetical protein